MRWTGFSGGFGFCGPEDGEDVTDEEADTPSICGENGLNDCGLPRLTSMDFCLTGFRGGAMGSVACVASNLG